jgi:hypothetical protein
VPGSCERKLSVAISAKTISATPAISNLVSSESSGSDSGCLDLLERVDFLTVGDLPGLVEGRPPGRLGDLLEREPLIPPG